MNGGGLPALLKKTAADARRLAQLQARLVANTVKAQARQKAIFAAVAAAGAFFILIGLLFLLASAAAGLAIVLPWWLSLLIVGLVLFIGGGLAGLIAVRGFAAKPEVPGTKSQ